MVDFYCPLLMLFLLKKVFGIPANEKHNLESKGKHGLKVPANHFQFYPLALQKTT